MREFGVAHVWFQCYENIRRRISKKKKKKKVL